MSGRVTTRCDLGVVVADDRRDRNDHAHIVGGASRHGGAGGDARQDVAGEVAGFADRMDVDAVGDLTGHPQHPRIDGGDVDIRIGGLDGPGAPLAVEEVEVVEVAVVVEWRTTETGEAGLHGEHVVTKARTGVVELDAVATGDVGPHLCAQPETEPAVGELLEFPGHLRRDHGTAWEGHGDACRELQLGRCERCRRDSGVGGTTTFGEQHPVEPCPSSLLGHCRPSRPAAWAGSSRRRA